MGCQFPAHDGHIKVYLLLIFAYESFFKFRGNNNTADSGPATIERLRAAGVNTGNVNGNCHHIKCQKTFL